MRSLLLAGIAALSVLAASAHARDERVMRMEVVPDAQTRKDGLVFVLHDTDDDKPILYVHFSENMSQEALRRYCPQVPADQGMIACAVLFEKEPTPRCRILLATKEVIRRHSKDTTLKIIEANTANCFRLVEQEAAKGETK